jgi:hypothetical protein
MEDNSSYVSEATITEEIREDFKKLGWYVVENTVEV